MKNSKNKLLGRSLLIVGLILPIHQAISAEPAFSKENDASYKPGNPVYDRWDKFYKIEKDQPQEAEKILVELGQMTPQDIKVWKSLTYLQIRLNKNDEAIQSVRKAEQLDPQNDELKLQEAYLLNQQRRNKEALAIFKDLSHSSDTEIATKAQQAVQNLSSGTVKTTFRDIYFAPSYESNISGAIFPLKLRYGRNLDEGKAQVYSFLSLNRDTHSTGLNNSSETKIFDDNAAVLGVGANYQPWQKIPIRLYAEVGGSYDLIDRADEKDATKVRSKFRESITAGAAGYKEWNANPDMENRSIWKDYFTDLYGNVATYSREDYNVIGDFRVRSGFNVYRGEIGAVQAYVKAHELFDTEGKEYNNLIEGGVGVAWQPFNYMPVKFRVEQLYGYRLKGTDKDYDNTRVEMVFYREF